MIIIHLRSTLPVSSGDAVISSSNNMGHLTILSSDDPNGLFQFDSNSTYIATSENSNITLM